MKDLGTHLSPPVHPPTQTSQVSVRRRRLKQAKTSAERNTETRGDIVIATDTITAVVDLGRPPEIPREIVPTAGVERVPQTVTTTSAVRAPGTVTLIGAGRTPETVIIIGVATTLETIDAASARRGTRTTINSVAAEARGIVHVHVQVLARLTEGNTRVVAPVQERTTMTKVTAVGHFQDDTKRVETRQANLIGIVESAPRHQSSGPVTMATGIRTKTTIVTLAPMLVSRGVAADLADPPSASALDATHQAYCVKKGKGNELAHVRILV